MNHIPSASYGILYQSPVGSDLDQAAEQIRSIGYAVVDSGMTTSELDEFSDEFNRTREQYIEVHGRAKLAGLDELNTIRSPLTHGSALFLRLVSNINLIDTLKKLISGKFILNQQNGIINPPQQNYNQSAWHRDLPYQHFISSKPLAINALFCVDDFTVENGATFVLPASHKSEAFPSSEYVNKHAVQIEAKAGSFILLDCMMFHAGGFNKTAVPRRAVNHVYNIPYFKQQINIPMNLDPEKLSQEERDLLGFNYIEPSSVLNYFSTRTGLK